MSKLGKHLLIHFVLFKERRKGVTLSLSSACNSLLDILPSIDLNHKMGLGLIVVVSVMRFSLEMN